LTDVVDALTRSRMMSGIRSSNTRPERVVRTCLHRAGFRYRLNNASLPGRPDLVLSKHRAVVFVHGCFWHCHACKYFKMPSTRQAFWKDKLARNVSRDRRVCRELRDANWRIAVVWECATRAPACDPKRLVSLLSEWLLDSDAEYVELRGTLANGISARRSTARSL